jgi:hypothetical protein
MGRIAHVGDDIDNKENEETDKSQAPVRSDEHVSFAGMRMEKVPINKYVIHKPYRATGKEKLRNIVQDRDIKQHRHKL